MPAPHQGQRFLSFMRALSCEEAEGLCCSLWLFFSCFLSVAGEKEKPKKPRRTPQDGPWLWHSLCLAPVAWATKARGGWPVPSPGCVSVCVPDTRCAMQIHLCLWKSKSEAHLLQGGTPESQAIVQYYGVWRAQCARAMLSHCTHFHR